MAAPGQHCPFLNRSEVRCSTHFRIDRLGQAFRHCFGAYQACPVYLELLVERRLRRLRGSALRPINAAGENQNAADRFVQVSISDRYAKPAA